MSILNVNQIQPVGSGQTVTISATNIDTGSATFTGSSSATFNNGLNVTGGRVGVGTNSPTTVTQFQVLGTSAGNTATFGGINQGTSGRVGGIILGTDTDNSSRRLWGIRGEASVAGQMGIFYSSDNVTTPFSGTQTVSLTSGGNVKIENGNLVFSTAGTGIDFSATADGSGTASSELLDDYEEGSWTPTLTDSSQANVYSSGTRYGYYTKVGRMVTATAVFDNATCVAGNNVKVGGLPYTITSTTTRYPGFNSHTTGAAISGTTIQGGYARPGETNFQLLQQNSFSTVNFSNGALYMFLTFIYVV